MGGRDICTETPASHWSHEGRPDPHGDRYSCERAALALGDHTDDELANAVFLHGGQNPSLEAMAAGVLPGIVYLTAAKDRIRWLSRQLVDAAAARKSAESALRDALAYVGYRNDGDLTTLAERSELWMRESKSLIDSRSKRADGEASHPYRRISGLQGVGDALDYLDRHPGDEYALRQLDERIAAIYSARGFTPPLAVPVEEPRGWIGTPADGGEAAATLNPDTRDDWVRYGRSIEPLFAVGARHVATVYAGPQPKAIGAAELGQLRERLCRRQSSGNHLRGVLGDSGHCGFLQTIVDQAALSLEQVGRMGGCR